MAKRHIIRLASPAVALTVALAATGCTPSASTARVSVPAGGAEADGPSFDPVMTRNGRFVVFGSQATNLENLGDPSVDETEDVFLKDRTTNALQVLSLSATGGEADGDSFFPATSADAARVAFTSTATNLRSTADANGPTTDVYLRERTSATTALVSSSSSEVQGNGRSSQPDVSPDGRLVAFTSQSNNLVPVDSNTAQDVFVRDLTLGTTVRASLSAVGGQLTAASERPAISDTGVVTFLTNAKATPADTDTDTDVYVRDTARGVTSLVSFVGPSTTAASADISADGRYVAFTSTSGSGVAQAWVRDRVTGQVTLVSERDLTGFPGNGSAFEASISDDGVSVGFTSAATDLVDGDTNGSIDAFVTDRNGGPITRVSVSTSGGQTNDFSTSAIPADGGRVIAFRSAATNVVDGDRNASTDIFVRTLG